VLSFAGIQVVTSASLQETICSTVKPSPDWVASHPTNPQGLLQKRTPWEALFLVFATHLVGHQNAQGKHTQGEVKGWSPWHQQTTAWGHPQVGLPHRNHHVGQMVPLLIVDWHLLPQPHWRSVIGKGLQLATVVPGPWRLGFTAQLHASSVQQFPPLGL